MSAPTSHATDPLGTLRQYAALAPWSLRDLSSLAGAILEASATFPVNATARQLPTERTIRFYVTRKLVSPPEGRGTAATYGYRHLLQVLAIKLQQMEGATLETLGREFASTPGDVLERRVAAALGPRLLSPAQLPLAAVTTTPRGKVGRAVHTWTSAPVAAPREPAANRPRTWRRILLGRGAELLVDDEHPLFAGGDEARLQALFQRILSDAVDGRPSPSSR
ncbi:MAG TPA: MerR family transcriptional regulator [Gemmatimonadales bacterium]|nr:MerR family transcriptional regulator [Gemmatimonadales bacterium]